MMHYSCGQSEDVGCASEDVFIFLPRVVLKLEGSELMGQGEGGSP